MQFIGNKLPTTELSPLLTGAGVAVAGAGATLALADLESPLRGPLTLFFLLAAPAAAIGTALRGLTPWGRAVASVSGAVAVDMLVAQGMLALHLWSVRGGVAAVAMLSSLILLPAAVRRHALAPYEGTAPTHRTKVDLLT
ncbi:hypothetical protein [Streptomyces sp. NPDC005865]|uniref:hypothetical protein n=1 Tax=Streptomyces sp. NPDC005865 TaxID=3155453 RepID=UPI0033CD7E88